MQCKLTTDELTLKEVENEVTKAERFMPRLHAFFVATSGERDAKIQTEVRLLSERRVAAGEFPVGIVFWDDLMENLTGSPSDFQKHYPQIRLASSSGDSAELPSAERDRLLSYAREQETLHKHFLQQARKLGAVASKNRAMWIEKARLAAEGCAGAYRSAGDGVAALRWEQTAKSTVP